MISTQPTELGFAIEQKVAKVRLLGWQGVPNDHPDAPGITLYTVVSAEGIAERSTVTKQSLVKQGFKVEVVK